MLSAIILTRDNEGTLSRCLESVRFCDEILVIDDYSTDKTTEIAQKFGAKVFRHRLDNDFAQSRNFGLEKARGAWVLFIDSDEEVPGELQKEIRNRIDTDNVNAFYIKRQDYFMGRILQYGETAHVRLLRLVKKDSGRWTRAVHEVWQTDKKTSELKNYLQHYPHPTITKFLSDINFYSDLHSRQLQKEGQQANILTIIFKPLGKFTVNFFPFFGFLDGTAGLIMAMMMSLHSFLSQVKLWQLQQKIKS